VISFLPTLALLVSLAAIFVVLFLAVLKILKSVSLFQGRTAVIMASCVAILCIVGLAQLLVAPRTEYRGQDANQKLESTGGYILLPYVTLAVAAAVILSQLLLMAGKNPQDIERQAPAPAADTGVGQGQPAKRTKARVASRKARKKRAS
jgi:hypothetical protein